jgi:predicted phage replisome organizer
LADVKWIKITTDIFDDEKILLIESLPDSYAIITVWFKLLCLAGKQNNSGVFMMGRIAYTDKMLATIFRMKESTVTLALQTFEQFEMVEIVDGVITIPNWGKHQNLEQLEERRKYQREYQKEYRRKQKLLAAPEEDNKCLREHLHKHNVNSLEEDKELEKEKEKELEKDNKISSDLQSVVDLYHSICVSYPRIRSLSDARKKVIKARLKSYSLDDFKVLFENAEASSFLKGTEGGWKASFDWLIKEANMLKVLEGNYTDKPKRYGYKEKVPGWMEHSLGDAELRSIQRILNDTTDYTEDDKYFQEEAEQLRKELQESFGRN